MARAARTAPSARAGVASVLVFYGTTEGHSAKVAAAIGATVRGEGLKVDVLDAEASQPDAEGYDAAIVVASVHKGDYQAAVRDWTRRHARALNAMPSAFVSVSLGVLQHDPKVEQDNESIRARFLEKTGWKPAAIKPVAGALMYSRYNVIERMLMKRIAAQASGDTDTSRDHEYTDWEDLAAFTRRFAAKIGV